jgi:hypothetical protein
LGDDDEQCDWRGWKNWGGLYMYIDLIRNSQSCLLSFSSLLLLAIEAGIVIYITARKHKNPSLLLFSHPPFFDRFNAGAWRGEANRTY